MQKAWLLLLFIFFSMVSNAQKSTAFLGTWDLIRVESANGKMNKKDVEELEANYIKTQLALAQKAKQTLTLADSAKIFKEAEDYFKRIFGFSMVFGRQNFYATNKWNTQTNTWLTETGTHYYDTIKKTILLVTFDTKKKVKSKTVGVIFLTPSVIKFTEKTTKGNFIIFMQRDGNPL